MSYSYSFFNEEFRGDKERVLEDVNEFVTAHVHPFHLVAVETRHEDAVFVAIVWYWQIDEKMDHSTAGFLE